MHFWGFGYVYRFNSKIGLYICPYHQVFRSYRHTIKINSHHSTNEFTEVSNLRTVSWDYSKLNFAKHLCNQVTLTMNEWLWGFQQPICSLADWWCSLTIGSSQHCHWQNLPVTIVALGTISVYLLSDVEIWIATATCFFGMWFDISQ